MVMCITDDVSFRRTRGARSKRSRAKWMAMPYRRNKTGLTTLLVMGCSLLGQHSAQAQDGTLRASIRKVESPRESIHIPVNKSVLIETNIPVNLFQTASPEIATVAPLSPTQVLVTGESFGRTQIIVGSPDGQQEIFDVSVELELDRLIEAINHADPLAKVEARAVMDTIMLTGTVSDAQAADRIMQIASIFASDVQNHLQVAGEQQVLLHCTIAEVGRSAIRQLGINGFLAGDNFKDMFLVNNIGGVNPTSMGAAAGAVTRNLPFVTPGSAVASNNALSFGFPRVQMQVFIRALKENGLLRVLAEPNLVTISGRTASFLAGGEFPIPVPQATSGGGITITIEYREFGARLSFTPVVLANQLIRLTVAPEVSELDFANAVQISGFTIPGLNSRRAETTVEIGNGQTLAMAGLLSENTRAVATKVPALGEVPVLGALFRSMEYRRNITELVILVTPQIVAPANPDQMAVIPGQGLTTPTDWQLFAQGLLEGEVTDGSNDWNGIDDSNTGVDTWNTDPTTQVSFFGPWGPSDMEEVE